MLGANRLAIEGLPLLPTIPVGRTLRTTGFTRDRKGRTYWNWPIWSGALSLDVVRSLMALPQVQKLPQVQSDPGPEELRNRGIVQIFRSCRLTVGKFRCFTPGEPI